MTDASGEKFGADPKPYYLAVGVLIALEFFRRAFLGYVPDDFTAYLAAADVFVGGGHPYGDAVFEVARYNGKVYNYPPGTLWLIAPLAWMPTAVAVALDWVARVLILFGSIRVFSKRLLPQTPPQAIMLIALFHQPLLVDALFGNVAAYLLGAFALCVWAADRDDGPGRFIAPFIAGLIFAFKPFWVFTGLFALAAGRRTRGFIACCAGAATMVLGSLPFLDLLDVYLARIQKMAEFYYSVALGTFAPWAIPIFAIAWAVAGAHLIRKRAPDLWVWGACSVCFWPRLGTYSYLITLPLLLFLAKRLGWLKSAVFFVIFVGPLPWLLRTAPGFEESFILEAWTSWITVWLMAGTTFYLLNRGTDDT